jgi:hypothetical protein
VRNLNERVGILEERGRAITEREVIAAVYTTLGFTSGGRLSKTDFFQRIARLPDSVRRFLDNEFPDMDHASLIEAMDPWGPVIPIGNSSTHHRTVQEALQVCRTPAVRTFLQWIARDNERATIPRAATFLKTRILCQYEALAELREPEYTTKQLEDLIDERINLRIGH